jgi:phage shock protein C
MTNQHHRLYRNQSNKVLAGVCSGIAEYLNIDPTIVRLVWILITFLGGAGIIAYILACIIIPVKPVAGSDSTSQPGHNFTAVRIFGILFIGVGILILLDNLDILSFHHWWYMTEDIIFPGLLILAGAYFLTKRRVTVAPSSATEPPVSTDPSSQEPPPQMGSTSGEQHKKILRRSVVEKKLFGICGGMGEYFDIDPTIIRVGYVLFTFFSGGAGILIYFLMYLIIPESEPQVKTQS